MRSAHDLLQRVDDLFHVIEMDVVLCSSRLKKVCVEERVDGSLVFWTEPLKLQPHAQALACPANTCWCNDILRQA